MSKKQTATIPEAATAHAQREDKRAVLYARVSSDDRSKDGRNLASQLEMCRTYAQERDYRIIAELHEDDRGASGASFELPQLGAILAMAERSEYNVLVVRELDRLSRNLAKQLIVEETLQRAGVSIEYVIGEYPDTPEGNLSKHIRATIAEFEREKIKERADRGRRNAVRSGKIILHGSPPPYGYSVSDDGRTLVVCDSEAQIVRLIYQWYTEGDENGKRLSTIGIADRLTGMQVPTWRDMHDGHLSKKRKRAEWVQSTVAHIIKSAVYMGRWYYSKKGNPREKWVPLDVPPIVSVETWEMAQRQRVVNRQTSERNVTHEYLMRYRVRCECGYGRECQAKYDSGKVRLYYRCVTSVGDTVKGNCGLPSFRAEQVDGLVWGWLKEYFQDPADLRNKLEAYKAERDKMKKPALALMRANENLIADNQSQLDRLLDLYLSGTFDKDVLTDRKTRLEGTIAKLELERSELQERLGGMPAGNEMDEVVAFAYDIAAGLEAADKDFAKRRRIIEVLNVRAILVVEDGEKVVYASFILTGEQSIRLILPRCERPVVNTSSRSNVHNQLNEIIISARLVLPNTRTRKPTADVGAFFAPVGASVEVTA